MRLGFWTYLLILMCLVSSILSAKKEEKKKGDDTKKPRTETPSNADIEEAGPSRTDQGSTARSDTGLNDAASATATTGCKHTGACNCPIEETPAVVEEPGSSCDHNGFCWCDRSLDHEPTSERSTSRPDSADTILFDNHNIDIPDYVLPEVQERMPTDQCRSLNSELFLLVGGTLDGLRELMARVGAMEANVLHLLRETTDDEVNGPAVILIERATRVFGNQLHDFRTLVQTRVRRAVQIHERGLYHMNAIGGLRNHFEVFMTMGVLVDIYREIGDGMVRLVFHNTGMIRRVQDIMHTAALNLQTMRGRDHKRSLEQLNDDLEGTLNFIEQLMTLHGTITDNIRNLFTTPPPPTAAAPVTFAQQPVARRAPEPEPEVDLVAERPRDVAAYTAGDDERCIICWDMIKEAKKIAVQTICKHKFCLKCIILWIRAHENCPICRKTLR